MGKRKVTRYSEEFRREAIALSEKPNKTARQVAESLGIHVNQIYNWRNQLKKLSKKQFQILDGVDYTKDEIDEIRRLKHENSKLKEERDFLKKAVAYFADRKE
jgi:transposase